MKVVVRRVFFPGKFESAQTDARAKSYGQNKIIAQNWNETGTGFLAHDFDQV